jgi:Spy/CpxP family protein refolding chaperone
MKALFLIPACAGLLLAQARGPGGPWWDNPTLASGLNLTDTQSKQILAINSQYRRKLIDLGKAVNRAEGQLEMVFNEENVDQQRAGEAIEQLVSARGELFRTTSQLELKIRSILTADQWRDLQERERTSRQGRGRRGPISKDVRPGGGRDGNTPRVDQSRGGGSGGASGATQLTSPNAPR